VLCVGSGGCERDDVDVGEQVDRDGGHPGRVAEQVLAEPGRDHRLILGDDRWDGLRDSTREMLRGEGLAFRADMACQAEPLFDIDLLKVPFVAGYGTDMRDHLLAANQRLVARTGADEYIGIGADHYAHLSSPDVWAGLVRRTVELAGH